MDSFIYLKKFTAHSFRNLSDLELEFAPTFNLFFGDNGSGKTSLIESIYCLSTNKSFRTHVISHIITQHKHSFLLTGLVASHPNNNLQDNYFIAIERSLSGDKTIKLNYDSIKSIAPITKRLPMQVISVDSHRFFSDGPKIRRAFLDWGVFHVKHEFLPLWQQLNKVLKQRNAALKGKQSATEIKLWDKEFVHLSEQIDCLRRGYTEKFLKLYYATLAELLKFEENSLKIRYDCGWSAGRSLENVLETQFSRDLSLGYTQYGAHRADLQLYINQTAVDDVLSQGQLKAAAYALYLAQGLLLKQETGVSPVYLIDDLPSELDENSQELVINILKQLNAQVFVSSISAESLAKLKGLDSKMFHVKQGKVFETA